MSDAQLMALNPLPFCDCKRGQMELYWTKKRVEEDRQAWAETERINAARRAARRNKLFVDAAIPERFRGLTLESFRKSFGGDKKQVLDAAVELRDTGKIKKSKGADGRDRGYYYGLWLWGDYGIGKTSILSGVFTPLMERLGGGLWLPYLSFLDQVRNGLNDGTATTLKQAAMLTPVLLFEDLGSMGRDMETTYTQEVLWQIIYHRNANNLLTLVSSNLSRMAIVEHFGSFGDGFFQRVAEFMCILEVKGRVIRDTV